jgi:acetolactate synthase I/II/III large subunit
MGESTSFWEPNLVPPQGFIHVDVDSAVFGAAYPTAKTLGVQAEVRDFVGQLLTHFPNSSPARRTSAVRRIRTSISPPREGKVRPAFLMQEIQSRIIDNTSAIVMAESGSAFGWATNHLCFREPNRYRVSVSYGSMGHFTTGVVGAALATNQKAVAIVGDGSMLMNNEINTAAAYSVPAVWIILNDSRYGIIEQAMRAQGFLVPNIAMPRTDFVAVARAMGADGIRVEQEVEIAPALMQALASDKPFVVDVFIDPEEQSPFLKRVESLIKQGATGRRGGVQA